MISAHEWFVRFHRCMNWVYVYDKADDGPECEIVARILATHPYLGVNWTYRDFLLDCFGL